MNRCLGFAHAAALLAVLFFITAFRFLNPAPYRFPTPKFFPPMPVSSNNPVTVAGVELGRRLFYDPILSKDSSLSCGGCHKQQSAFADGGVAFSVGANGALQPRNTMPLFNLAWAGTYFWDGRAGSLEDQVFEPVRAHREMNLDWPTAVQRIRKSKDYRPLFEAAFPRQRVDSVLVAKAIAQFERTLVSYRSRYDSVLAGLASFTPDEREGFVLMNDMTKGDCLHCHTTDANALGTTFAFSN
ncbi:MAG TPA: cytochrome-c peroxidase, partial [Chitinophagales bacterium]|nr:cytochrome-c peroxidase [Chitinophagales bacterium]